MQTLTRKPLMITLPSINDTPYKMITMGGQVDMS